MGINYWQDFECEASYHIYNKSNSQTLLFREKVDYDIFLKKFTQYLAPYLHTYAYCLIPNHFHFMVKVKHEDLITENARLDKTSMSIKFIENNISVNKFLINQWKRFFSSYANSYRNKYAYEGSLFLKRFKRLELKSESKFINLLCYIHHNPIHHGLAQTYISWPHSSFNSYLSDHKTKLSKGEILKYFGGLNKFLEIHNLYLMEQSNSYLDPINPAMVS